MNNLPHAPIVTSRRSRAALAVIVFIGALSLSGCSSYQAPTLRVVDARVIDRAPDGAVVQFTVEAQNSNAKPLPLRDVRYTLDLGGNIVFTGVRSAEATIAAAGKQQFLLPAAVATASLSGVARYRLSASLTYVTPGAFAELLFDTGVARPSAPLAAEGEIDFGPAARAQPAPPLSAAAR